MWTKSNLLGCTLGWLPICPWDLFLRTQLCLFSEFRILQAPASSHCFFSCSFIHLFSSFFLHKVYKSNVVKQLAGSICFSWIPPGSMALIQISTDATGRVHWIFLKCHIIPGPPCPVSDAVRSQGKEKEKEALLVSF